MEVWSLSELLRRTGNTNKEFEDFIPVLHLCQHVCERLWTRAALRLDEIQRCVILSALDLILPPRVQTDEVYIQDHVCFDCLGPAWLS